MEHLPKVIRAIGAVTRLRRAEIVTEHPLISKGQLGTKDEFVRIGHFGLVNEQLREKLISELHRAGFQGGIAGNAAGPWVIDMTHKKGSFYLELTPGENTPIKLYSFKAKGGIARFGPLTRRKFAKEVGKLF